MTKEFDQATAMPGERIGSDASTLDAPSDLMFSEVMSQTRMAIALSDPNQPDDPLVFVNKAFCNLTGYDPDEVLGRNCRFLQGEGTDPQKVAELGKAIKERQVTVTELLNYRKDGTPFWNALHVSPVYGENGEHLYNYGSQWDVSNVHAARADEAHARNLSRELSHRMKNMFSVMNAIVQMTGRAETDALTASDKISGRIMALGRAHEATLASASGTEPVDLAPMLSTVLGPYDQGDRIAFAGVPVRIDNNAVSMLGLTLHELAINAMKYGALSNDEGRVALSWDTEADEEEDRILLRWRERGGPQVAAPARPGLGRGIIGNLLAAADGSIDYDWDEAGLTAVITIPLPKE